MWLVWLVWGSMEVDGMYIGKPSETDHVVLNVKWLPHDVIDLSSAQGEPTRGGEQRALHVRACMHACHPLHI